MKFEVIGWTNGEDETYPDHIGDFPAVDRAVVEALRAGGYRFDGAEHQYGSTGTPVLSDGTKAGYSMRAWGEIMAEALGLADDGTAYMEWYIDEEDLYREHSRAILPPRGVDESRIRPREELAEEFVCPLPPAAFEAVVSGKKTAEICVPDEERECVSADDLFVYESGGRRCRVRVTGVEVLPSFADMLRTTTGKDDERDPGICALTERALYPGCETPQKLFRELAARYPKGENTMFTAKAFLFELVGEK